MKRKLIALTTACALSMGTLTIVLAEDEANGEPGRHRHGERGHHHWRNPFGKLSEDLNLTAEQKAKVQPILDQTKPQIRAIHEDAMQKTKAVMDNTMAQIRPLLTPEQQKKLEDLQKARENSRKTRRELQEAKEQ